MQRSLGPRWPLSLAPVAAALASGCSGNPTPPAITPVPSATASLTASPTASAATEPSACEAAATQRARVAGLLREGKLDRALAVIARADRLCATSAQASVGERVATLIEVGRDDEARAVIAAIEHDASAIEATKATAATAKTQLSATASGPRPDGEGLYQRGLTRLAAGDRPSAQRLFDRAIVALERAARAEPGQEQAQLTLDTPNGISGMIGDVVWARAGDRSTLAVAHDEHVSLFDGSTFRLRKQLHGEGTLTSLAVSPDGTTLAGGSFEALRFWDVASGKEIERRPGAYTNAVWSGDGKTMAVINADDPRLEIWDAATKVVRRIIVPSRAPTPPPKSAKGAVASPAPPKKLYIHALRLSEKGDRVAASFNDGTARVWKSDVGDELHTFGGHTTAVLSLLFSRDDRLFVTADQNGVQVYDARRFKELRTFAEGYSGQVAFTPDQRALAVSTVSGLVLWDVKTGKERSRVEDLMPDTIAVEASGERVAVSEIGRVIIRDLAGNKEIQRIVGHAPAVHAVAWMPDGRAVISASWDGTLRIWDARKGTPLQTIEDEGYANTLAVSPDGLLLASGTAGSTTTLYRLPSGEKVERWKTASGWVNALAFSPDGKQLLIGAKESEVRVVDLATRRVARTLPTGGSVSALAFSPDGTMVAAGTDASTLHLYETASSSEIASFKARAGVHALSFDPGGSTLLVGSTNTLLFDTLGGHLRQAGSLEGHATWVSSVAVSNDGKVIATGSGDRSVRLWDRATSALRSSLNGHDSVVRSVAFRPDGALLTSSSDDGTIRLWSVEKGREIVAFRAVEDSEDAYAITPAPDARIELFGEAGRAFPLCRIGERTYRFELCQERFEVPGMTEKVLAGDDSYLDP